MDMGHLQVRRWRPRIQTYCKSEGLLFSNLIIIDTSAVLRNSLAPFIQTTALKMYMTRPALAQWRLDVVANLSD